MRVGNLPDGIDAAGIHTFLGAIIDLDKLPGTVTKDFHRLGEDVVVDETSVNGEDAHQQDNVTTAVDHAKDLRMNDYFYFIFLKKRETLPARYLVALGGFGQRLFIVDNVYGDKGHEETMAKIAKHDGEEEGERDERKHGRVDFLVASDTVGVHDDLEGLGELVGAVEGRGHFFGLENVHDRGDDRL